MPFWVVNVYNNSISLHGKYATRKGAENRMSCLSGGDSYIFDSDSGDEQTVRREFEKALMNRISDGR